MSQLAVLTHWPLAERRLLDMRPQQSSHDRLIGPDAQDQLQALDEHRLKPLKQHKSSGCDALALLAYFLRPVVLA